MSDSILDSATAYACNLTGPAQQARGREVANLFQSVQEVVELPDGYGFAFPGGADWAGQLLQFVLTERECCPFFTFDLLFAPDHRRVWLQLRGSAEVKALLAQEWLTSLPA